MKPVIKIIFFLTLFAMSGCKKNHSSSPSPDEVIAAKRKTNSSPRDGTFVRDATKDHTLPPYIRDSAEIFTRVLDGVESDNKAFDQAVNEMAATRNERTCRIWVSMLHASETGLPEVLPSLEVLGKMEKQAREGTLKGIESNPLRFLDVLGPCLIFLTQFDMLEADREVTNFVSRFEAKYGNSEAGKHFLNQYQVEIKQAKEARMTGAVLWKEGRKNPANSIE